MKIGVAGKIDVTTIIREAMFKRQKGTYLDFKVFIDIDVQDQYGNNGMVTQELSKEARDRNEQGPILGNVKVFWDDVQGAHQQAPQQQQGGYQQAPQQAPQQQQRAPQQPQQAPQQSNRQQSPNQNIPPSNQYQSQQQQQQPAPDFTDFDDDIPFANPYKNIEYLL